MLNDADRLGPAEETLVLNGRSLSLADYARVVRGRRTVQIPADPALEERLRQSVKVVERAVQTGECVYGITTGFGGMANQPVPPESAAALQNNLLSFLAAGAGEVIDDHHTRGAMLLRANVLLQARSGVRQDVIERLVQFLNADAVPLVRELGSIGASGDLIPLATIARAITGQTNHVRVRFENEEADNQTVMEKLGLQPIKLRPKEGLALVNGTSFSAAVAANVVLELQSLFSVAVCAQAMMLRSLLVQMDPFDEFVHQSKPHPGQILIARIMRDLLDGGAALSGTDATALVQDRYSLRCLPQYLGPIVEGLARVQQVVETEMNGVSDNPLIDIEDGRFYQSGNFLGQYIAIAMDDARRFIGLTAKHLDVQIASLVAPEFSGGLPSSLRGNGELAFNMGLKGLQISANSIMPLLTYLGNPLTEHFPTHAEQFNQNINGLSWGSAHMAWKSVGMFRQYVSMSLIFAVQSLDLRAKSLFGHCDGRALLGEHAAAIYDAVYKVTGSDKSADVPFLRDDAERWLERDVAALANDLEIGTELNSAASFVREQLSTLSGTDA